VSPPRPKSWKAAAARLAKTILAARLHPRVRVWLENHALAQDAWAVAVSGGADSVALLLLIWAHFPKKQRRLCVLHFDHATRPESVADAQFVQKLSRALGLRYATARRAPGGATSEAELREARWKFFHKQMIARSARVIFLGHQRDDIAETMLMRLARGSGAGGLSAPRPVRLLDHGAVALRPLLDLGHDELCAALRAAGAEWREDASNASDAYLRNRLRRAVLPAWRAALDGRDLAAGTARSRALLEEDDEALEALARAAQPAVAPGEPLPLMRLTKQPRAIFRRILHGWLNDNGVGEILRASAFEVLLDAVVAARSGRWSAGRGRWLELKDDCLSLVADQPRDPPAMVRRVLQPGETLELPSGACLQSRLIKVTPKLLAHLRTGQTGPEAHAWLAWPRADAAFCVRSWQAGDRYRPLGAPGRRKLQDLFTDKKIPSRERLRLPLVCTDANDPLWAPGLPPAHERRLTASTRLALELTFCPPGERIERSQQLDERQSK
jgi:tRNA(Ile)-lysidine synthase